jgi:hypothetical protein
MKGKKRLTFAIAYVAKAKANVEKSEAWIVSCPRNPSMLQNVPGYSPFFSVTIRAVVVRLEFKKSAMKSERRRRVYCFIGLIKTEFKEKYK